MMSDILAFIQNFLHRSIGMSLSDDKAYLIHTRLNPLLQAYQLQNLHQMVEQLMANPEGELAHAVIDAMTTHETYWFRDPRIFDHLQHQVFPQLLATKEKQQPLRIWSAACSTGQEAYSLAMLLHENGWTSLPGKISIQATDVSHQTLQRAADGIYSTFEISRGLSLERQHQYFQAVDSAWQIMGSLRKLVSFQHHNLMTARLREGPLFDIILCRNVLIYFDPESRLRVMKELLRHLRPGGRLILGSAESLQQSMLLPQLQTDGVPGVYRLQSEKWS